jgi:hypothetical protein
MNNEWIGIWNNTIVNYLKGESCLSAAESEEIHDRLEQNVLGQTTSSRCESSSEFQGLTLSPSSGLGGVIPWNFGELKHFDAAVCPGTFY